MLIKGLGIGGAERVVGEGSRCWDRDAFAYRVAYVLPWKDQLVGDLEGRDIPVTCLGAGRTARGATWRLRRLVREWRPDLVHAHLPATGIMARLVGGAPVVYTEHNVASSYRLPTRLANFATYARNRAVIAVSEAVAASLRGYPGPEPRVVPNGVWVEVEDGIRERIRAELGIEGARPLVVHVGNIRPGKGHDDLVAATVELAGRIPEVAVVSVGVEKRPGDLARLRSAAATAGVGGTLRFLGRRADAVSIIAAADVFVNPSRIEGLPLVVLEAMFVGTPVVATAAGGVPSVVRDGDTGRLVPVGDPAALAAAVAEQLEDRSRARAMAHRAEALVRERHGVGRMVTANEAVYREVLGG